MNKTAHVVTLSTLLFGCSFSAFAASYYSEPTDGNRPRCVAVSGRKNAFFYWDESNPYRREIKVKFQNSNCTDWRDILKSYLGWSTLTEQTALVLSADTQHALEQVRNGASEIRAEQTAVEFLRHNPIATYDFSVNTSLTKRFGMGFSAEVYRTYVESQLTSANAKNVIQAKFSKFFLQTELEPTLGAQSKVLFASGFGVDTDLSATTPDYVRKILLENQLYKFPFQTMGNNLTGDLEFNAQKYAQQIESELNAGYDVVLVGLSKGVPELLRAVAIVSQGKLTSEKIQVTASGRGRILGLVNYSGLVRGTFVGDRYRSFGGANVLAEFLKYTDLRYGSNNLGEYLDQLKELDQRSVTEFTNATWHNLPADINYINVAGAITDFSKPVPNFLEGNKLFDLARSFKLTDMAHDGLINLPGVSVPSFLGSRVSTIVLEGTHTVFDGIFAGHDLSIQRNRLAFNKAVFELASEQP